MLEIDSNPPKPPPGDNWVRVADLAAARGVSIQSIYSSLRLWARQGVPLQIIRRGSYRLIDQREYEHRRGEVTSPATGAETVRLRKSANVGPSVGPPSYEMQAGPRVDTIPIGTYTEAQARKTAYDAELKKVDLDKALGRTIDRAELTKAAVDGAATMAAVILRLHRRAEEIRTVDLRDGLVGLRTFLKSIERDMMAQIAEEFAKMASAESAKE